MMIKKRFFVTAISVLLLTGCSASSESIESPDVTPIESKTDSQATPSASAPKTSDRGNLIKKVGQTAGLTDIDGTPTVNFVVSDIKQNIKCEADYPIETENGHLIALKMDIDVKKNFAEPDYPGLTFSADASSWSFVSKNGTTFNGDLGTNAALNCLDDTKTLPWRGIGPAQKASGLVVLDVPELSGTLIFHHQGQAGWEWELKD